MCIQGFSIKICNSECEEPQTRPLDPGQIRRRSKPQTSKGPLEHRNPRKTIAGTTVTPSREEQGRIPGEPHSSHSAEASGNCSRLCQSRSSHGPRDSGKYHSPSKDPTEPRGPGPSKQPPGVIQHTPKHPAPNTASLPAQTLFS
ncbi:hypothetical protein ILYODFUR_037069 [Ilyodon furcidens]|uniref:Uncharacterized protein n=1 Tax=Ilyodon furcidens TaxID=33524 RepID=A0ABV0TR57_9TELE